MSIWLIRNKTILFFQFISLRSGRIVRKLCNYILKNIHFKKFHTTNRCSQTNTGFSFAYFKFSQRITKNVTLLFTRLFHFLFYEIVPFSTLRDQVSISPTFYEQLLRPQIPRAQMTVKLSSFFALLGSSRVKAARWMLVKLTKGHKNVVKKWAPT